MAQDHRIEPLAREVAAVSWPNIPWRDLSEPLRDESRRIAAFILDRESKRVGPLVEAAGAVLTNSDFGRFERFIGRRGTYISVQLAALDSLSAAFSAYRALDAPPAPSLAEAVEAMLAARDNFGCVMDPKAVAAVRAALAREREKAKP